MQKLLRFFAVTVSVGLTAYVIPKLIVFLEQDDCLDSGGALNSAGVCIVETGSHYSPLFGPQTPYVVWLILFGIASIMILGISKFGFVVIDSLLVKTKTNDATNRLT